MLAGSSRLWSPDLEIIVNDFDLPAADLPVVDEPVSETPPPPVTVPVETVSVPTPPPVDPVRAAAGRLGARRRQELTELGRQYEREHGLTPGRQRLRQLIQLGKRYESEHGLRVVKPRRRAKGDTWTEFLAVLAWVVKPAYRPAVEKLIAALNDRGESAAA
jgi:hypothetical protein